VRVVKTVLVLVLSILDFTTTVIQYQVCSYGPCWSSQHVRVVKAVLVLVLGDLDFTTTVIQCHMCSYVARWS